MSSSDCALCCNEVSFRTCRVLQPFHLQVVPCTEPHVWLQSSQDHVAIPWHSDVLEEKPPALARSPVEFTQCLGWGFFPQKSILNIFHFSSYRLSFLPAFSKAFPLKWITVLCLNLKFQMELYTQGMASQNSHWKSTWSSQEEAIWMSGYVLEHVRQQNCLSCLSSHTHPHSRDAFPSSLCGNISESVPAMCGDIAPHGGRQESPVPKSSGCKHTQPLPMEETASTALGRALSYSE